MSSLPAFAAPALIAATLVQLALPAAVRAGPQDGQSDNPVSIPVTPAQARAEVELTKRLNREQAEFAQRQLAANAAAKRAHALAEAERAATIARQQQEHAAEIAAYEATREERERDHAEAMARWRADVAACKAGDISRCAPPEPQP